MHPLQAEVPQLVHSFGPDSSTNADISLIASPVSPNQLLTLAIAAGGGVRWGWLDASEGGRGGER